MTMLFTKCLEWLEGLSVRGLLACLALMVLPVSTASAQTYLPSVKIGTAPLIAPADADSFYGSSTTHTVGPGAPASRPPELVELARALKNSPDLIYEYIHNNIQVVWLYGLQKGALGAAIDKSGTPFDQAMLMVELLRQAGYTASYQAGTITLTGAQFYAWTGISNAVAACQMLSSGGIPAAINGTTSATCSYGASIDTVQLAHIWVQVNIGGTNYVFDPSYKTSTWKTGIDLAAAAGLTTGQALALATGASSGMTSGTLTGAVPYIHGLNAAALNGQLATYQANLLAYLRNNNLSGAQMEDIVGGGVLDNYVSPPGGLRQTALPYTAAVQHSWSSGIPNQYRTTLAVGGTMISYVKVEAGDPNPYDTMFNVMFYADDIYGRALMLDTDLGSGTGIQIFNNTITLTVDGVVQATYTNVMPSDIHATARGDASNIVLTANHPYAAVAPGSSTAGTYMDETVTKTVDLGTPATIVAAWGDTGPGLLAKWSSEKDHDRYMPPVLLACNPNGGNEDCINLKTGGQGDFDREKLAAGWMAQFTRATHLGAQVAGSVPQIHHAIGVAYAQGLWSKSWPQPCIGTPQACQSYYIYTAPEESLTDNFNRLDVDTAMSLTSRTADPVKRRAGLHAIAASSAALEGSIAGQMDDAPDTASTASRFEWGNAPPGTSGNSDPAMVYDPSGVGPRNFVQFNSGNASAAASLVLAEGVTSTTDIGGPIAYGAEPDLTQNDVISFRNALSSAIADYAAAGFTVSGSQESFLGPGQRGGHIQTTQYGPLTFYTHDLTMQRGGAFVATRYDANGDPVEIAHVVLGTQIDVNGSSGITKGGGGGGQATSGQDYAPAAPADVLKARFADRSNAMGVNLQTGSYGYTSPASLTVGTGGFPYALTATTTWNPGTPHDGHLAGPPTAFAPRTGWTSNWQNELTLSGSAMEAMGASDVRAAAGSIAAFLAALDVYSATPSLQRDVAGVLVQSWWVHQIDGNVATMSLGTSSRQFLRVAPGQWVASGGGYATLTQTGTRVPFEWRCGTQAPPYASSRGWDKSGLSFTVTNEGGDVQHFGYWFNEYKVSPWDDAVCGRAEGFRLNNWTFPSGVKINLVYGDLYAVGTSGATLEHLVEVNNSLGRKLDFTWAFEDITGVSNGLSGADARSIGVTWSMPGFPGGTAASFTDPAGAVTSFTYVPAQTGSATQRPLPYELIDKIFTADNASLANIDIDYDGVNRVKQIRDGDAIQLGGRGPYTFFIADGTRGERDDPLGAPYTVVYDIYGHPARYLDELGRETDALLDGRGRPVRYTYPEHDCEVMAYDERNNPTDLWRVDKASSCNTGAGASHVLHLSQTYLEGATVQTCANVITCNKPATQTNARGTVTNYSWDSVSGLLTQVLLPADSHGARPQTGYGYGSFGTDGFKLLTSKTVKIDASRNLVTTYAYNASNDYVPQTVTVDPSGLNLVTTLTYDAQGDVTETNGPRSDVADLSDTTYDLDRRPLFQVQADPDGAGAHPRPATLTSYDVLGRPTLVQQGTASDGIGSGFSAVGAAVATTYDPVGNKLKDSTGTRVTQYAYDGDNRLLCTAIRMNPAVFASEPSDACTLGTQGSYGPDRIAKSIYDAAGQVTQIIRGLGTGATQIAYATNTYTPNGKLLTVTDADGAGHTTTYAYDGFDRATLTTYATGTAAQVSEQVTSYDADGNVLTRLDRAGASFTMTYDALDRLLTKAVPAVSGVSPANTVTTDYDLVNHPITVSDTYGNTLTNSYDVMGRVTSATRTTPNLAAKTVSYAYDNGIGDKVDRYRLTWADGYYANYQFDALGHPTTVTDSAGTVLATYGYDNLARRAQVQYNGTTGAKMLYAWSAENDLLTQSSDFAGTASDVAYTNTFSPAHQWLTATTANAAFRYVPTATGSQSYAAVNALNQYTTIGANTQSYDVRGNFTGVGATSFGYDAENRLMGASAAGLAYAYDPLGRRTGKTMAGTTTNFVHDGDTEIAEYDGSGTLLRRYVPGPAIDEYIAMVTASGTKTFFHTDKMGSVVAMSDMSGNLSEGPYRYDSYGRCFSGAGLCSAGVPFRYTGQRMDTETLLYYYRARFYSPTLGRFYQTDPVGYKDDLNAYMYVHDDPTDGTDPTGMAFGLDDLAGIVGGAVVGVGVEVVKDYATGEKVTWGSVAGAAASGAIIGWGAVNAPETGGLSAVAAASVAGGVGGAVGNAIKQGVDIGTGDQKGGFSTKEVAVSGAVGAVLGGVTEGVLPDAKIPGLSSGRGNMKAVAQGVRTKIGNGTAQKMSAKTAVKSAIGSQAADAYKTVAEAAGDAARTRACNNSGMQSVCH